MTLMNHKQIKLPFVSDTNKFTDFILPFILPSFFYLVVTFEPHLMKCISKAYAFSQRHLLYIDFIEPENV